MRPINIYLLDDDPVFQGAMRQALGEYLDARGTAFTLKTFLRGEDMLKSLAGEETLDLLISDIDLGREGLSGLETARRVRQQRPECAIIYLTAYLEFATEIYETAPLYFILKEEYCQRIAPAMELFFARQGRGKETISLTVSREQVAVPLAALRYCERVGRKTRVVLEDREYLVTDTIVELMGRLPGDRFAICHKGYLVGLRFVRSCQRYQASLTSGETIPVSRSRYEAFREAFAAYLSR